MSRPTRRTSTAYLTVWRRAAEDEFGRQTWSSPSLLKATVDIGSNYKYTSKGIQIVPRSAYWMETSASDPSEGDQIAKGDFVTIAELDPVSVQVAEIIKSIKVTDCSSLRGGQIDDILIMT